MRNTLISDLYYNLWGRMRKKIIFGSVLVLTLLFLIPSIQGVQSDFSEKKLYLNDKPLGYSPLFLTLFINNIFRMRAIRGTAFYRISSYWGRIGLEVTNPVLFARGYWLLATAMIWMHIWGQIYDYFDWCGLLFEPPFL
jgi:hypothetical protein